MRKGSSYFSFLISCGYTFPINTKHRIAAIVLAAGASTRFGANKLLQPFGDETVIARVLREVAASGCAPIVLVTGHDRERVEAAIPAPLRERVTLAHNAHHAQGEMLSSVKTGLIALGRSDLYDQLKATLIIPGDMPLLTAGILQNVMNACDPRECEIVVPKFKSQRGHPVLFARSLWAELLALGPKQNPRDVLMAHPDAIHQIEIDDEAILLDVDTPEKYEMALKRRWTMDDGR